MLLESIHDINANYIISTNLLTFRDRFTTGELLAVTI